MREDLQFRTYCKNWQILILPVLTITLTMKIAKQQTLKIASSFCNEIFWGWFDREIRFIILYWGFWESDLIDMKRKCFLLFFYRGLLLFCTVLTSTFAVSWHFQSVLSYFSVFIIHKTLTGTTRSLMRIYTWSFRMHIPKGDLGLKSQPKDFCTDHNEVETRGAGAKPST